MLTYSIRCSHGVSNESEPAGTICFLDERKQKIRTCCSLFAGASLGIPDSCQLCSPVTHYKGWRLTHIFVLDDSPLSGYYWADIAKSDPRINRLLSIKILDFHSYFLPTTHLVSLIFMHLPSSLLLAWTVIKDILKWVLQPSKPKQQTPLSAAVLLKETNTSKPAFFVVFYFLFTFSSFSPSVFLCWRGSELFAIWPFKECFKKSFACDLVYAPDIYTTKTFPSSHLNGGMDSSFLLPVFSSSPLYFPPLLCVWGELRSPHQSPKIPFFCPGCYEKGAEGV